MSKENFIVGGDSGAIPGSERFRCSKCGTQVFLAPMGQRRRREDNLTVVCTDCALKGIEQDPDPKVGLTGDMRDVLDELAQAMGHRRRN